MFIARKFFLFICLFIVGKNHNLISMEQREPHEVLGLNRGASQEEIKKAYRRKAFETHPDRNSQSDAKERFEEVQRAYEILTGRAQSNESFPVNPFCPEEIDATIREFHSGQMDSKTKQYWLRTGYFHRFQGVRPPDQTASAEERNAYDAAVRNLSDDITGDSERINRNEENCKTSRSILKFYYLRKCIVLDLINSLNEIYRICVLGNTNASSIRSAAIIDSIFNVSSMLLLPIRAFNQIYQTYISEYEEGTIVRTARFANILPSLSAIKFFMHDRFLSNKAKKISKYNKKANLDLQDKKIIQGVWLGLNKIVPYLGFIYSRLKNDKATIGNVFNSMEIAQSDGKSNDVMMVLRTLANISEMIRKYYLCKLEVDGFKKWHKDRKKKSEENKQLSDLILEKIKKETR